MKLGRSTFALLVAVVATFGVSSSATAIGTPSPSPSVSTINGITVHTVDSIKTSAELDAFLLSATPKTVQVDAATGKVTSVTQGAPMMTQSVTVTNTCDTSKQSCLFAASVPYANNGFSGIGTKTGSWPNKISWCTGPYTAKAWYTLNGATVGWGVKFGPQTTVNMNLPVTAVQVTNYS